MSKQLTQALVDTVAASMKSKRREKFLASVAILNESLALGGWLPRGEVKATSGFYQGLSTAFSGCRHHGLSMCMSYGSAKYRGYGNDKPLSEITDAELAKVCPKKLSVETMRAWIALSFESDAAHAELHASRPLPKITAIGLSPKVTETLTGMGLDIDLPSIRMAKISFYLQPEVDEKTGKVIVDEKTGNAVMVRVYYVDWTPGTLFDMSRFAGRDCEACGKTIPSQRFVAIEADCKTHGHIGLWIGCDCAKNIFGIKDVGVSKSGVGDVR